VATRIIVSRERERMAFRTAGYWDVTAELDASVSDAQASPPKFSAKLNTVDGKRVASGRDFDSLGAVRKPDEVMVLDEASASALAGGLRGAQLSVASVEQKPYTRRPYPPFMTSTLQQEAGRKLRFSSERTMSIAQRLYENGYITYMRTDSTTLSETAINAARNQARQLYGEEYVHPTARQYTRKVKNAQEAHEAIRPSGDVFQTPGQLHSALDNDEFRLYELIWQRTVASQMADARGTTLSLRIAGSARTGEQVVFSASGRTITFAGFLKAYVESLDEQAGGEADDAESRLPNLTQGQRVDAADLTADGHTTSPPARFTEASLIKSLEELGIGRPSTYSSIIKTIQDRGYVHKKGSALVPSWVAFAVIGLLEQHFGRLVDYDFTAAMEDELDEIAAGNERRTNWLNNFYFGGDHGADGSIARSGGLKKLVGGNLEEIDAREVNSIKLFDDDQGRAIFVRVGRNGPYLERMVAGDDGEPTPQRANLKDELTPDELTLELAEKLFSTPQEGRSLGVDPATGHEVVAKDGRYGPYVTEVLPAPPEEPDDGAPAKKGKKPPTGPKPRTGSLLQSMDLETVTLEDALKLLSLPRVVGADPASGEEITAQNGRYGPYLKRGTDSRSLANEDQMFTITLEEALKIYSEPKRRGRQGAATPPLRELGADPVSEKPMVIKDGRFGPYVTDGETNASLRKGDDVTSITDARASELLADRRARGPVKKKAPAKKAAKKAPAKKAAAKKAATKKG
jgi:DNA topoisomerase-1